MREITVTVKLVGWASSVLDNKEYEVSAPEGTTLRQLLGILSQRHGDVFNDRVWTPEGDLRQDFKVFFGLEDMSDPSGLESEVKPGKIKLFFLQGIVGGAS